MQSANIRPQPLKLTTGFTKRLVVLFLLAFPISFAACASWRKPPPPLGVERCPVMTDKALNSYADNHSNLDLEFRVWMGQTIRYCEDVNLRLDH